MACKKKTVHGQEQKQIGEEEKRRKAEKNRVQMTTVHVAEVWVELSILFSSSFRKDLLNFNFQPRASSTARPANAKQ